VVGHMVWRAFRHPEACPEAARAIVEGRPIAQRAGRSAMLVLEVSRLREGQDPFDRVVAAADLPREEDYRVVAPVELVSRVGRDRANVSVTGTATTTLELDCSRCLEPYRVPVKADFDLRYLPQVEAPDPGEEIAIDDEDVNTAFYKGGVIDIGEMLHEQLYLTLPMKPLCRPDCRGLCPVCGVNRNVASCDCDARWEDPRLAALKALLDDNDDA
jgi:uncharacterized protein